MRDLEHTRKQAYMQILKKKQQEDEQKITAIFHP